MKLVSASCPNCGAKIEVDKNSDKTVCDYCGSQIVVEDAIKKYKVELSGEVDVKNMPKLENYLKLGERHYNNSEYEEAYNEYSKAVELDPDNSVAVFRKGLSKAMISNYKDFNLKVATNALKEYIKLIDNNDDKDNKNAKINSSIEECLKAVLHLQNLATNFYKNNEIYLNDIKEYTLKLKNCLESYEFLYSLVIEDDKLKVKILKSILNLIDILCIDNTYTEISADGSKVHKFYKNRSDTKHYKELKVLYKQELQILDPPDTSKKKKKKNDKKYYNIVLCWIMVVIGITMALSFIPDGRILACIVWAVLAVFFIPAFKKYIMENIKINENIIIAIRIILVIIAFMLV